MAEIAFGVAETVLAKLASKGLKEINLAKSAKDNLKELGETMQILKLKLKDAEKKQSRNEELRIWLVKLKDLLNDFVDVLDEFDCEVLRRQVVNDYGTFAKKVRRFCSGSNPLVFRFRLARLVKGIRERFGEITKEMAQFQLISSQLNCHEEQSHVSDRMTHSYVKSSEVIGRDGDKAALIDMLMRQNGCDGYDNLSLIPIVGLGGLGKTTLAKSVFNDEKVQERFELRLWVCVSLDFDVTCLLREILKSANYTEQDHCRSSLDQLQNSVRATLEGCRFLLVLDDVWNEDRVKWLDLRQLLTGGAEGSKVIVTTRSTVVSSIMTRAPPHKLQGLSEEDSLSLFFRHSFGDEKLAGQHQRLKDIGSGIVKKCGGVPLALKTLGSLLFSQPEAKWVSVRDNEIWEMEHEDDHILPALRLSYNAMSSSLQQCFAYCSKFQQDAIMDSHDLTLIWMALGILQSPNDKMELEDVGHSLLRELCAMSFLQRTNDDDEGGDEETGYGCNMHDLIHDLACSIAKSEYSVVKSGSKDISDSTRNVGILSTHISPTIVHKFKKLRSLNVDSTAVKDISESFLSMCIKQSKCLRVFDLSGLPFEELPSSIGTLKHLRYLNLSGNDSIKRLPNSICKLQSLQTLLLHGCYSLEGLPRDIRNLVSLRILYITTKQTHFREEGIGRLKALQMLVIALCGDLRFLPRDMAYCSTLRHLIIMSCPQLDLACTDDTVIPLNLQTFTIRRLLETTALPQWLKGASNILKKLVIEECDKLVALPEWLQGFTSLERLVIKYCPQILTLPSGTRHLSCLTHLEIHQCEKLNLTSTHDGVVDLKLKKFIISGLPNTTALPSWLHGASETLQVLEIYNCENLASLPERLSYLTALQKLEIQNCNELFAFQEDMQRLTSLSDLVIISCNKLKFPNESYQGARLSLKEVTLGLEQMTDLPQWLQGASHTLKCLSLHGCHNLATLPERLPDLNSLEKLDIWLCTKLSTLPEGMPRLTSLTDLEYGGCSSAFHARYTPDIGEDWKSIAHIPKVFVGVEPKDGDTTDEDETCEGFTEEE